MEFNSFGLRTVRLFQRLAEEEMRRKVPFSYKNMTVEQHNQKIFKILDIDRKKYIQSHVSAFEEEQLAAKVGVSSI